MTRKLILDCDPGQDDAISLFMAFAARDRFDILGVIAVAGNTSLEKTHRNARILCELTQHTDIRVYAGCDAPLHHPLATAEEVHGREGLDGIEIYTPQMPLQTQHGVDFLIDTLLGSEDETITIVPTGPLTNLATALTRQPKIAPKIKEIVLMGGAYREGGNITPSAEFNFYVDPHAAQIVLECERPITVFGLDVTHQVLSSPDILARIKSINNKVAQAAHQILQDYSRFEIDRYGIDGGPLHDPCTMAYLLQEDLFEFKQCNLRVEADSPLARGHCVLDFWNTKPLPKNVKWAHHVNHEKFFDLLITQLEKYS